MEPSEKFVPIHINANEEDFMGNNGIGRYFLLPGSEGRAKHIAEEYFSDIEIKTCSRAHTLYMGTIEHKGHKIDVATISTGMGCSSVEIILTELLNLGGKRFIRVGTAGSLQNDWIKAGDIINVCGAVRDEDATMHYLPKEYPALASSEVVLVILEAAKLLGLTKHMHTGVAHCKSSLYGRQLGEGPKSPENKRYMNLLRNTGVLATEMETSMLFILSTVYSHILEERYEHHPLKRVLTGAILSIASDGLEFSDEETIKKGVDTSIHLAIESIKILAEQERIQ